MRSLCTFALVLGGALALGGCASGQAGSAASSMIPAPASGTAWKVVGGGGAVSAAGTVPDGQPVFDVDASGQIRASIPASPESQQAAGALAPETFGAIQVRRAP